MVGLPWRKDKSLLPNNYPLAEKRLFSLERNLLKDEAKAQLYDDAIMEYEKKWLGPPPERRIFQSQCQTGALSPSPRNIPT